MMPVRCSASLKYHYASKFRSLSSHAACLANTRDKELWPLTLKDDLCDTTCILDSDILFVFPCLSTRIRPKLVPD